LIQFKLLYRKIHQKVSKKHLQKQTEPSGFTIMSKNQENTYQFPAQIQREYHQLMKSKDYFLKNLSNAEQRKLITLYGQLQDAWNRNNIQKLEEDLNQKYTELREIQKRTEKFLASIEENKTRQLTEIEVKSRKEFSENLQMRKGFLKTKKNTLEKKKQTLIEKKKSFETDIMRESTEFQLQVTNIIAKWKQDILKKEADLKVSKEQQNLLLANLEKESSQLEKMLLENNELAQSYEPKSNYLETIKNKLNLNIQVQKDTLRDYYQEEKVLKENLKAYEKNLTENLKAKELSLMKNTELLQKTLKIQLKQEILKESNIQENLKNYLKTWDNYTITQLRENCANDTEKHTIALHRVLTRIGKNEEEFLDLMDKNI